MLVSQATNASVHASVLSSNANDAACPQHVQGVSPGIHAAILHLQQANGKADSDNEAQATSPRAGVKVITHLESPVTSCPPVALESHKSHPGQTIAL